VERWWYTTDTVYVVCTLYTVARYARTSVLVTDWGMRNVALEELYGLPGGVKFGTRRKMIYIRRIDPFAHHLHLLRARWPHNLPCATEPRSSQVEFGEPFALGEFCAIQTYKFAFGKGVLVVDKFCGS
jgi:hypothetical protein